VFGLVDFETLAIHRDVQAVGDVFSEGAFGRGLAVGQLAPPLDGNHLPSARHALLDNVRAERPGNYIANSFEIRHGKPPQTRIRFLHSAIVGPNAGIISKWPTGSFDTG